VPQPQLLGISPTCCGFEPDSVDLDQRQRWCFDQVDTCAILCERGLSKNSCNAVGRFAVVVFSSLSERQTDLSYECDCSTTFGGKLSRNVSGFAQTLPSYQCSVWKIRCSASHSKDASAAAGCVSVSRGKRNATEFVRDLSPSSSDRTSASCNLPTPDPALPAPTLAASESDPEVSLWTKQVKVGIAIPLGMIVAVLVGLLLLYLLRRRQAIDESDVKLLQLEVGLEVQTTLRYPSQFEKPELADTDLRSPCLASELEGTSVDRPSLDRPWMSGALVAPTPNRLRGQIQVLNVPSLDVNAVVARAELSSNTTPKPTSSTLDPSDHRHGPVSLCAPSRQTFRHHALSTSPDVELPPSSTPLLLKRSHSDASELARLGEEDRRSDDGISAEFWFSELIKRQKALQTRIREAESQS